MKGLKARFWNQIGAMYRLVGMRGRNHAALLQAERAFTRAIQADQDFHPARFNRGILYWRELSDPDRAISDFDSVISNIPDALFMRGMAYQARGDYHNAATDLRAYLIKYPDSVSCANAARQLHFIELILSDMEPPLALP